jgi:hypothetical protein
MLLAHSATSDVTVTIIYCYCIRCFPLLVLAVHAQEQVCEFRWLQQ